jgi:hypothetical protein
LNRTAPHRQLPFISSASSQAALGTIAAIRLPRSLVVRISRTGESSTDVWRGSGARLEAIVADRNSPQKHICERGWCCWQRMASAKSVVFLTGDRGFEFCLPPTESPCLEGIRLPTSKGRALPRVCAAWSSKTAWRAILHRHLRRPSGLVAAEEIIARQLGLAFSLAPRELWPKVGDGVTG